MAELEVGSKEWVADWIKKRKAKRISKAKSLTKAERASTAKKKKRSGGRKQFVMNTKKAKVSG